MKIAFITIYFPPIAGGEGNNAYFLARELAKKHEVHIYTADRRGDSILKKEENLNGIKIHRYTPDIHKGYHFLFSIKMIRDLNKESFDVMHFCSFGVIQNDLILLKKLKKGGRTVFINTPAHPSFSFDYPFPKNLIVNYIKKIEREKINPRYDKIIAISENQDKWMKEWGVKKEKIALVPPGINKENFRRTNKKRIGEKLGILNHKIIGYVGRIQEYKGLSQIIEALPRIKKEVRNVKVLFIGSDSYYKEELIKLAKKLDLEKDVVFTGEVSEKEKIDLLSIMDVFVLPSKIEGFGIVMLEAMAQQVPIISTKTDGGNFLIKNNENGFLYDFGKIKDLERDIIKLLTDEKLRKKIIKNNLKKAGNFLWSNQAKKLEEIYKEELRKIKDDKAL
ncbi:glycosyltransferase family 4 protein [Candidatus Pacearchaeota archaeon]|nr:glycosyltransferase family 4 protein [Candidatus Pacearchaeota archaeon]